jgi:nitrogen fixation protein NifU and related proteins
MKEDRDITLEILKKLFAVTGQSYSEKLLDYGTSLDNARPLEKHDGYGRLTADDCGDVVEIWLRVRDDRIEEATFQTTGCLPSYASVAAAVALAKGRPIRDCLRITQSAIIEELGGMPEKDHHCALFAARAFQRALRSYVTGKKGKTAWGFQAGQQIVQLRHRARFLREEERRTGRDIMPGRSRIVYL